MQGKKIISIFIILIGISLIITGLIQLYPKTKTLPKQEEKTKEEKQEELKQNKKQIIVAMERYMSASTSDVTASIYPFTEQNTIYALPIECIKVEETPINPLGNWNPVTDEYWAYVLVHCEESKLLYTYGFVFKDSAGYGIYPKASTALETDGSQIMENIELSRPRNGLITDLTLLENWKDSEFVVNEETRLVVLEATESGNNLTTCTIK